MYAYACECMCVCMCMHVCVSVCVCVVCGVVIVIYLVIFTLLIVGDALEVKCLLCWGGLLRDRMALHVHVHVHHNQVIAKHTCTCKPVR